MNRPDIDDAWPDGAASVSPENEMLEQERQWDGENASHSSSSSEASAVDPVSITEQRACPVCDGGSSVPIVVREHVECGYVTLGGAVIDESEIVQCPKCEAGDLSFDEAFRAVGTVHSCVRCGRILDRSLGRVVDSGRSGERPGKTELDL